MTNSIDWGVPIEDFPMGGWDNFDGKVASIEYEDGQFGTQIHIQIQLEEYEYEAKGYEYDPDGLPPIQQWYGMGGNEDTYEVSEDGYEVSGPQPNKRTRAVRLIKGLVQHGGVNITGGSVKPLEGVTVHWKNVEDGGRNPNTGEKSTATHFYPISSAVGAKGSSISEELVSEAHDVVRAVMSTEETLTIRNFATKAIEHQGVYSADAIKLASQPSTIESAVRAGVIVKVDERTIKLA